MKRATEAEHSRQVRPTHPFMEFKKSEIEQSIASRFEQQAGRYPDRLAVKTRDRIVTYDELNRIANRVGHAVRALAGDRNTPIALIAESDPSMIAAILGILKAGKIYLPLDLSLPRSRLEYILKEAEAEVLVTNNKNLSLAEELTSRKLKRINIDRLDSDVSEQNLGLTIRPDALAWILYTSSSTGDPKGVLQTHRDELHNVMHLTNSHHFCADDRMTLLRNPSVGGAIRNVFSALLNGTSLFPWDIKNEGHSGLAEWLNREEITVFHSAATVFRNFAQTLTGRETFPKLRLIRVGSEPVTWRDVELYRKHFSSDCILVNALSSTEARTFLQYFVDKETPPTGEVLPVGYPVDDMEILLLDEQGQEVEGGEIGEIVIRSRYLFPGYWRREDLTREVFSPDPNREDRVVLRTGDLGRIVANGAYEHRGRKDFQLKVRGHRVQIDEVESALRSLPEVDQAVIVAQEWNGGQRLVAYVVPQAGQTPKISQLRRVLRTKLPEYMIPSVFVALDSLPQTPTGKVDRKRLPPPDSEKSETPESFVEPRSAVEQVLARLWSEALGVGPIGIHDHFLDLGGNSLLAGDIASKINRIFSVHLTPYTLLEATSVAKLSETLSTVETNAELVDAIARTWLKIGQMGAGEIRQTIEEERKKRGNAG